MTSLKIPTQRIFNNLIKQNQKLSSDSVLNQSTTVSGVQSPESSIQSLASRVQGPASRIQHSTLVSRSMKSGMPKKPSNTLRSEKTYDLKISMSIIYKGMFCYIFSTPKLVPQAQNEKKSLN